MQQLELENISIEVEQKDVKNINLSVYPPEGRVRITAPSQMDMDTIRVFAISKLQWIDITYMFIVLIFSCIIS